MDNDVFMWIGIFAFPIAIIALLFAMTSGTTYGFNQTQFIENGTNISINQTWISSFGNTTNINNTYINQTVNATVNTTQFDSNNPIHIKESWLSSFISSSVDLSNYWKNDGSSEATDNWDLGSYSFTAFDIISNGGAFQGGQYSITDDGILQFYDNGISDVGLIDFINGVFNFDKNVIAPNLCYSNGTNCVTYPTNWTNVSANYLKLDQTIPQTFTNLGTVSTEDILSASLPLGGSVTDKRGVKFLTKTSSSIVQIKKIGNANPTIAYLMDSSFSQLANATFVGNVATFDYDLANNTYYYAVADKGGSAYTQGYSSTVAYPVSGTNVDFITGYAGGDTASYYLNINSITTNTPGTGNGFLKITNGTLDADTGVFILDQSTPQTVTGTPIFSGGLLAGDKIKLTQTDGDEFIDSLADGYVDIYATLGIRTNRRLYIPGFTTTSSLALGTLEFQNYGLGNSWFGDNIYYDGTVFRRRATGSAGMFYFQSNEGQFRFFPSGNAGTDPGTGGSYVQMKTSASGQWGVGGATGSGINTATGSFTGAQLYKNANGDVGIGTITPTYKLHVIGNASFQNTNINGSINITQNLYATNITASNYFSADNSIGWTGDCVNASYKNGLVVGCND